MGPRHVAPPPPPPPPRAYPHTEADPFLKQHPLLIFPLHGPRILFEVMYGKKMQV